MSWNITPECISLFTLIIIWIYSRKGSYLPTLKNRLFQGCIMVTFCAISTNILSTMLLYRYTSFPLALTVFITTIYFILTPLMGMVYFLYSAAVIYTERRSLFSILKWGCLPGLAYVVLVFVNLFSGCLFSLTLSDGYVRGPLISVTYIIFYAYCLASVFLVLLNRHLVDRQIYRILSTFPIIAVVVIVIQQMYPTIILSGSAATYALLIIYLHLQNKQISLDSLTNVPNRAELLNMMEILLKKSSHFSLLVVSLRDFKQVNNTFGQQTGDELLKKVCQYLGQISPPGGVYRFSGDEFAILIQNFEEDTIMNIVNELKKRMLLPWQHKDCSSLIYVAVGIARYPDSATTLESLINAIEYAIQRAKIDKYHQFCYCNQEMMDSLNRKRQIIQILNEKLADNSFELYYQPIITLENDKYQYAESLLRIHDSVLGSIPPSEFIPIAEETGLIVEMTYQILEKVCCFVNELLAENIPIDSVHVNFSALQFSQPDLTQRVTQIIEQNGTPLSTIKIEFTESTIAENTQVVTDFAIDMAKKGVRMGLDDFGTGYSNLASVIRIPFDTLKLDKSLIWSAMTQENSAVVVRNLARTFKELGMTVIAEGVETDKQVAFVKECNIDQIQGFYYAKPLPAKEAKAFFASHQ